MLYYQKNLSNTNKHNKKFVILFKDDTKPDILALKQDLEMLQQELAELKKSISQSTWQPYNSFRQIGE